MSAKTPTANDILAVAASQIGVREGRNASGSWNNRVKYTTWYADAIGDKAFLTSAWCAIFVSWCANQVGAMKTIIPMHAWTPAGLAWFTKRGQVVKTPRRGDVFYVYYPSKGRVAHVGLVESVSGGYITTIEGNTNTTGSSQGNGVYRLKRKITSNLKFCRPKYGTTAAAKPAATPKPAAKPKPPAQLRLVDTVSVKDLKAARYADPPKKGEPHGPYADQVYTLETALAKTKWLAWKYVDGHYGSSTVGDGSRGYGGTTGFQRKHSRTENPDGWLGRQELSKLFLLAGMRVHIRP